MRIYAYKTGSETAKKLASALGTKVVRKDGEFRNNFNHKILNWGSTEFPNWKYNDGTFINNPTHVRNSVDKVQTLKTLFLNNIKTVEFTEIKEDAQKWIEQGYTVVVRKKTRSYGGDGIEIVSEGELPNARLYTKFIPKSREYRVHVFSGKVIDIQQKKRRSGLEERPDGLIKNHANGWVFCRDEITSFPENMTQVALNTIKSLGLDFGAVDMLSKDGEVYVLEVNSAPGLDGTTLNKYLEQIKIYA